MDTGTARQWTNANRHFENCHSAIGISLLGNTQAFHYPSEMILKRIVDSDASQIHQRNLVLLYRLIWINTVTVLVQLNSHCSLTKLLVFVTIIIDSRPYKYNSSSYYFHFKFHNSHWIIIAKNVKNCPKIFTMTSQFLLIASGTCEKTSITRFLRIFYYS